MGMIGIGPAAGEAAAAAAAADAEASGTECTTGAAPLTLVTLVTIGGAEPAAAPPYSGVGACVVGV
jgi:hypothetical protein